jgi:RNA polymerase sigma-70 factor (ECF subfamily)
MNSDPHRSFESFFEEAKDHAYRAILVSSRRPAQAEDAVAEAFARAWERWDTVGSLENPLGWVIRTAMNRYTSDWRVWRREVQEPPPIAAVEDTSIDEELVALVWRLPRRQRQVVALRVLGDLSEHETAQMLKISPKTVSVHLHRALVGLRSLLVRPHEGTDPWTIKTSLDA